MAIDLEQLRAKRPLARSFYIDDDVVQISQNLLGKILVSQINGQLTAGRIVETEAYRAPDDQASHAANNRRTQRTETMYQIGGTAYIYLIYGLHHLFNVVTGPEDTPHAVLIRGLEPLIGIDKMLERRRLSKVKTQLSAGPGVLSQALGINKAFDTIDLTTINSPIWITSDAYLLKKTDIETGTRVGVAYAGIDAYRPWRFSIKNNPWVSKGKGLVK
ncbi:MAG: DNA-3-methyladenine glycosylase [Saprospiraceae bacterium]